MYSFLIGTLKTGRRLSAICASFRLSTASYPTRFHGIIVHNSLLNSGWSYANKEGLSVCLHSIILFSAYMVHTVNQRNGRPFFSISGIPEVAVRQSQCALWNPVATMSALSRALRKNVTDTFFIDIKIPRSND